MVQWLDIAAISGSTIFMELIKISLSAAQGSVFILFTMSGGVPTGAFVELYVHQIGTMLVALHSPLSGLQKEPREHD